MKKFLLLFLFAFLFHSEKTTAQITLDTVITPYFGFGYDFFPTQISPTETKYVVCDTVTNSFSLYNMDFSPFLLNIAVPQPFGLFDYQVMYVSRGLFDCDTTNIEYAYGATTTANLPYYVMRTDGTQLFRVDSAFGPYCIGGCQGLSDYTRPIRNTSAGAKLFLYKTNTGAINIYSLCGSLPTEVLDFSSTNQSFVQLFPNPTSSTLTFQINPPDNMNDFDLVILDNTGREVQRQKVNFSNNKYTMDVTSLSGGMYFYSLCTKTKAYQSGKFIITK